MDPRSETLLTVLPAVSRKLLVQCQAQQVKLLLQDLRPVNIVIFPLVTDTGVAPGGLEGGFRSGNFRLHNFCHALQQVQAHGLIAGVLQPEPQVFKL